MPEKIIRDPVHDVIAFRLERPVDALLYRLLNAAESNGCGESASSHGQLRLPGADHSRYSHSLGVMETARKILDQLRHTVAVDEEQETVCLAAALLHDLGHARSATCSSGSAASTTNAHRPGRGRPRQRGPPHPLPPRQAAARAGAGPAQLQAQPQLCCDVLSSQLDADRLDYLLRDNHMTGSRYGDYDLNVAAARVHNRPRD